MSDTLTGSGAATARSAADPIIDSQIHVWLPESPERPWPRDGRVLPQLEGGFAVERALTLMDEAGVDRAVLVPPSWEGERPEYVLDAVQRYPQRFAAMLRLPIDDPALPGRLGTWIARPGVFGVRVTFSRPAEKAWLADPAQSAWFWAEAEALGMPVMALPIDAFQRQALDAVATRHPRLKLIIDHMGVYHINTAHADWAGTMRDITALARHPEVCVKVSCLPLGSTGAAPYADLEPWLRQVVSAYGAQRCFWGTDITRLIGRTTWRGCIDHIEGLPFLTAADKAQILGRALAARLGWAV